MRAPNIARYNVGMTYPHQLLASDLSHLLDHTTSEIPIIGSIRDDGDVYALRPVQAAARCSRLACKYHPDDGYHAAPCTSRRVTSALSMSPAPYLICITGRVRDACLSRPAFIKRLSGGGRFGMVDRVTADVICVRAMPVGRSGRSGKHRARRRGDGLHPRGPTGHTGAVPAALDRCPPVDDQFHSEVTGASE